jgi:hypothetical protein
MKFSFTTRLLALMHCLLATQGVFGEIRRDLELDTLLTTINHTHTQYGYDALESLLAHPTTDKQVLEGRQAAIAYIAQNTKLNMLLNATLQTFKKYESHFTQIMQPASDIETAALKDFYYSSDYYKKWNYSPAYLELGYVGHCANLCSSMAQHALAFAIFTWGLEEEHVCASHPAKNDAHDHKKKEHKHHDHDHKHKNCKHHSHPIPTGLKALVQTPQFRAAFQLWHGVAQIQEFYGLCTVINADMNRIKELQTQLMGVARGIKLLTQINTLVANNPELIPHLTQYEEIENVVMSINVSEKLKALLQLLQTSTFKGEASAFSRIGVILAAHKLAQEVGHELKPALAALGEIDAYTSCAQLYNNSASSPCRYSFAHYAKTTTPTLHAHNFWHPLVTTKNIQLNSITLGANNVPRNIVLTGPNACGKSTNVKALTLCAYLAQTITLVPAEHYSQSIYKEIYSSMVVSDKITEDMSLFVTELRHAEQLLERVEKLKDNEYMIIALDELFNSTHHAKGQLVAQRLLEELYASPRVITLISTHFEQLIALADKHNNICANYTVNNFVLEPGIGSPDHSFDLVEKQTKSRLLDSI